MSDPMHIIHKGDLYDLLKFSMKVNRNSNRVVRNSMAEAIQKENARSLIPFSYQPKPAMSPLKVHLTEVSV